MQSDIQLLRELLRVAKKAYMFPDVEEIAAQLRHTIKKIDPSWNILRDCAALFPPPNSPK